MGLHQIARNAGLIPTINSPLYPAIRTRVNYLIKAIDFYGFSFPAGFSEMFGSDDAREKMREPEQFNLSLADRAVDSVFQELLEFTNRKISATRAPTMDEGEVERIVGRYCLMVPAEGCRSLTDILNAAWRVAEDPNFWSDSPFADKRLEILHDLVLKNIEVLEIEQIQSEKSHAAQ
jgi:hypothetical protein